MFYIVKIRRLLKKWPGERLFGEFRFLPFFFVAGAALEYSMINWHVGEVNFYKTYKRRRVEEMVKAKLQDAKEQSTASS